MIYKEEQERLERERQAELQRKENERIAREREAKLAENWRKEAEKSKVKKSSDEVKQQRIKKNVQNIIGKYYNLEQLQSINMGGIILRPIDGELAMEEYHHTYLKTMMELSPNIQRFLPYLNWNTESDIKNFFLRYCNLCELGYQFGYSIQLAEGHVLGFIFIHTPDFNQNSINFPNWTIDFMILSPFEGKGYMTNIIARVLFTLKEKFGVKKLYAYTDKQNSRCLALLRRLPFDLENNSLTDPQTGKEALLYSINLSTINFQKR